MSDKRYVLVYNRYRYCCIDENAVKHKFEKVFRFLHTLSADYRNIFVYYYTGSLTVRQLSVKYSLAEMTVKRCLNIGRKKSEIG